LKDAARGGDEEEGGERREVEIGKKQEEVCRVSGVGCGV
jgi:hypothetical protein